MDESGNIDAGGGAVKVDLGDLAIFGGAPAFPVPLHVNRPNAGARADFEAYLDRAWQTRWFTNDGPLATELEARLAERLAVAHCVLTCNGTAAMALTVRALGLSGEVIIPSYTFVSTAHVLHLAGLRPVFCDIDPVTWTIDAGHCARLVTARTSALIGTHLWGRACDVEALGAIAADAGAHLLFDAAHAFGSTHRGLPIGRFGTAEIFSFHATKAFHTFEGGAVATNDDALARELRSARNFGFVGYDAVAEAGVNAKMSEIHAAMGLTNLASLDATFARSRAAHEAYSEALASIEGLSVLRYYGDEVSSRHYVVVTLDPDAPLTRDEVVQVLHAENVVARRYFHPGCHRLEPYRTLYPEADAALPVTRRVAASVIVLPGGAEVSAEEAERVSGLLRFVLENAQPIRGRLDARRSP